MIKWFTSLLKREPEKTCKNCNQPIERNKSNEFHQWRHKNRWVTCFDSKGNPIYLTAEPME